MTIQTTTARPADTTIPYPALHHDGVYTWKSPTRAKSIFFGVAVTLAFLGASAYLQFISEDEYAIVFSKLVTVPAVVFTAFGALVGLIMLALAFRPVAPWYQEWSYIEALEKEEGLRLFSGRLGPNHGGLLVRRGEVVEISGSRGDSVDEAELLVTAPGGTLEVEVDTFVTSLTITPLEQAAARYGIELRLSGVATEIPRANKA